MPACLKLLPLLLVFTACTTPQQSEPSDTPASQSTDPNPITPLEDVVAPGDYNNDGPADTLVPGASSDHDIPEDPFLERVQNRPAPE